MAALSYTQLDRSKKTIRLLTVAPGDPEEHIRCELTHADLDERPSFIALSYTWDQAGGQDEIECCGTAIEVGKNLRNFLHRFRIWDEGRRSRLWIDALCINQIDVHERNHQVGQMRDLYSTATSAIAWLGEASSDSDLAYLAMSATRHCVRYSSQKTRQALADLLNLPYWLRVWVIQEFLLPEHLSVWWNSYRVKADNFRQVVWAMTQLSPRHEPRYPIIWETPGRILLHYRENYQRMRLTKDDLSLKAFREKLRLQTLLQSFSASKYTITYDAVYALLGIASDIPDSSYPISPDYSKPPAGVVLDVLRNQYRSADPLEKMRRSRASFRDCLDQPFIHTLDLDQPEEREWHQDFLNKHMMENDRSRKVDDFIERICRIMRVGRSELVAHIFEKLPRIEREIYDTLSAYRTMNLLFETSKVEKLFIVSSDGVLPTVMESFGSITEIPECLSALQGYFNSRWSYATYKPWSAGAATSLIETLIEFRKIHSRGKKRGPWKYFGIPKKSETFLKDLWGLQDIDPNIRSVPTVNYGYPKQNIAAGKASVERLGILMTKSIVLIVRFPIPQITENVLWVIWPSTSGRV